MSRYKKEKEFLIEINDFNRECVTTEQVKKIKINYPRVPIEFIDFLIEIGAGSFKNSCFEIKNFLFTMDDIGLKEIYNISPSIIFFGNSISGDFVGFDFSTSNCFIIILEHETGDIYNTGLSFDAFIKAEIGC